MLDRKYFSDSRYSVPEPGVQVGTGDDDPVMPCRPMRAGKKPFPESWKNPPVSGKGSGQVKVALGCVGLLHHGTVLDVTIP